MQYMMVCALREPISLHGKHITAVSSSACAAGVICCSCALLWQAHCRMSQDNGPICDDV